MAKINIKLGQTVRDVVSGFSGIAIQKLEQFNGNVQFAIQPKQKEGEITYPDAFNIDYHMIEVIDDGVSDRVTKAVTTTLNLGEQVRDKVSGLVGIALDKATYMNGCVSFAVMPERRDSDLLNTNPDKNWISVERLERVGDGLAQQKIAAKPVGGPSQKTQRSC